MSEVEQRKAEIRRKCELVMRYGVHRDGCPAPWKLEDGSCKCGLEAARVALGPPISTEAS